MTRPPQDTASADKEEDLAKGIVAHMNEDHADALLLYARAFGGVPGARSARLLAINPRQMVLDCDCDGGRTETKILFEPPLEDLGGARERLVDLLARARRLLDVA